MVVNELRRSAQLRLIYDNRPKDRTGLEVQFSDVDAPGHTCSSSAATRYFCPTIGRGRSCGILPSKMDSPAIRSIGRAFLDRKSDTASYSSSANVPDFGFFPHPANSPDHPTWPGLPPPQIARCWRPRLWNPFPPASIPSIPLFPLFCRTRYDNPSRRTRSL